MGYGKKNVIKIDPLSYNIGLIGESGIGKTTIIKEMCEKLAGEDGYIFLECGKEDGADGINGINYLNCPEWSMDYDELTNSIGFEDFIDDVVENKTTEYPNLKTVVIDTYDQLLEISKPEVIRMHNSENPDKPVKSIKAAFGGYMAGEDKATEIVLDKLWELKTVGVHFIIIGHVKQRQQDDVATGQTYTSLTTNMSMRDFNAIKTKLHFLGVASIDREIVQEKTGKTKKEKGKDIDIMKGVITKESRKITFRDDSYSIDSKSRFADIVPEIPFDVDELIKALTDAIKTEASKGSKSISDLEKEQKAAEAERMKQIAEVEASNKVKKELDEINSKIKEFCTVNKSKPAVLKPLIEAAKACGLKNPMAAEDVETAKKILSAVA
ncbi:AAA family ATPase [Blautia intestinalis]|uniref:AAA family ATPase n=1 Tax=Blautia intestinalis TaxID=2763028 RepID=UPI0022E3EAB8|nr:AAA family ATPase [Blautia intestinalis]